MNFLTAARLPVLQIHRGLNALLPYEIAVREIQEVNSGFHARYKARWKTYEYLIWNHAIRSPLKARYAWHVPTKLNFRKMKQAAKRFEGLHDFKSFCAAHGSAKSTKRTIRSFELTRGGDLISFRIEADGFLYHMVRNLVGTLVEIGKGRIKAKDIDLILTAKDRRASGPTAPAVGLSLVHVTY